MSKICPDCNVSYDDSHKICPKCKSNLLTLQGKDPLTGRLIEDRFTILEKLGTGGMGSVYMAKQHSLDKNVALKILHRELAEDLQSIKRFLREAKASSKLEHPNTITIFDFGQTSDGILFIAMELLRGKSLAEILKTEKRLPLERASRIIFQVCDSLSEAHSKGIVHRDLKPDNIYITEKIGNPAPADEYQQSEDFEEIYVSKTEDIQTAKDVSLEIRKITRKPKSCPEGLICPDR
jgi:serine/threonine-protein kinase